MDLKKQREEDLRRTQRDLELHQQSLSESAKQGASLPSPRRAEQGENRCKRRWAAVWPRGM